MIRKIKAAIRWYMWALKDPLTDDEKAELQVFSM
jgi:hypothetical protein